MNLNTEYLGLSLRTPIVASASPLTKDFANIKKMEDAGVSAIVLHSLFEEQLVHDQYQLHYGTTQGTYSSPEALTFFPEWDEYKVGPDEYLELISNAKKSVKVPIIASLNGTSIGTWTEFSKKMEQAGADAIELNTYNLPVQFDKTSDEIEQTYIDILKSIKNEVKVPVAVKLSPYFTNLSGFAKRLQDAGANSLVLFNRFYQPDLNLEKLQAETNIHLSYPESMRIPLRWLGILYGRIKTDLGATGGIYTGVDVVKLMMVGANVAMLCSSLLKHGIDHIKTVENEMAKWMEVNEYESVKQMRGSMSQANNPDPTAFERALYMKSLVKFKF